MKVEAHPTPTLPPTASTRAPRAIDSAPTGQQTARQIGNRSILSASLEVSIKSGDQSMSLLFKTTIENLNETLTPEFGPNAIDAAAATGASGINELDVSPQATADRIVALSTGLFQLYQDSNPDKDLATALKDFSELIGGAIDKGFEEARKILDGLGVLQGDIASNIDQTYDLVQAGLQAFIDRINGESAGDPASKVAAPAA